MKKLFFVFSFTLMVASKELCAMWPPVFSFTNQTEKDLTVVLSREDTFQELSEDKTQVLSVRKELSLPAKKQGILLDLFSLSDEGNELLQALAQKAATDYETKPFRPQQEIKKLKVFCAGKFVKEITQDREITQDQLGFEITITLEDLAALHDDR